MPPGLALALATVLAQAAPPAPVAPLPAPSQFQARVDDPMLAPMPLADERLGTWQEALALVRSRSVDLWTAQAGVDRAEGRWRQALSALLPNARLTASGVTDVLHPDVPALTGGVGTASGPGKVPTAPVGTLSATATQTLVDVGAWRGLDSARASERSAVASLDDTRRRLTQGLAQSLVAVVAAERAAELNRVGLRQALERAALTERTAELGAATQLDIVRVRQDVEVARSALISGDEQLLRTREALGLVVGGDRGVGVVTGFRLDGLFEGPDASCRPLGELSARPDLVAAREQVEASAKSRGQATAGYLPTLGVNTTLFGFTTEPGPGRFASWNVAAVLSVPLWEGGLRGGLVRERAGLERQAEASLEGARRRVNVEALRARRAVQVADALAKTAAESRALAERTDQLTRRSFEVGRSSSLELVQSAAALRQAELTLTLREFELVQAKLDAFLTEARCDW